MDKSLILAVAGSGKTTLIVDKLNLEERFLLITYTINNTRNLKEAIVT
jgi:DNA helicase-2/ATP-dependent DNA helicase PcrA